MWNTLQTLKKMDETENTLNSPGFFVVKTRAKTNFAQALQMYSMK